MRPRPATEAIFRSPPQDGAGAGLWRELRVILGALLRSSARRGLAVIVAAIVAVVAVTAYGQIRLNQWNKPFFDALSRRDFQDFLWQLAVFCIIAGCLLVLNVGQRWLVETLKIRLRQALVGDLLQHWLSHRRAFWLAHSGAMGVNPDQRIHEDARKFCELSADLGAGLLQAAILFASFASLLWLLSADFSLQVGNRAYLIPGFMLWAAIAYAGGGSLLSYWVGGGLIHRNAERYAREAELRFALVRINEHLDGISLAAGEGDEQRRVEVHLANVLTATRRLVTGLTNLTWITAGFGWVTTVAPIIVAAPLYFEGRITFGGLMMAAAAFTQAQSSLRWFVDNFSTIADWRATLLRVASFREALTSGSGAERDEDTQTEMHADRIRYVRGAAEAIGIDELEIASPTGREALQERHVLVRAGERVLIVGNPGTNRTLLFRALAGLWPWGAGRISLPPEERILFVPRGTPYLPRGTLREVLAYPHKVEAFGAPGFEHALRRLGLEQLLPRLDATERWDRELSQEDQLRLGFARVVLQAPRWILIDDALATLEDEALARVLDVLNTDLAGSTLIHIGRMAEAKPLRMSRVLHLVRGGAAVWLTFALVVLGLQPVAARGQGLDFRPPAAISDARLNAAMRDLAERVLPVYQDSDSLQYLRNVAALQFAAGAYAAADATRLRLRARQRGTPQDMPDPEGLLFDLYLHSRALDVAAPIPFGEVLHRLVSGLSDREAFMVLDGGEAADTVLRNRLQRRLDELRTAGPLTPAAAAELVWRYVCFDARRRLGPALAALEPEENRRRYLTDDVRIEGRDHVPIVAVTLRPRSAAGRLPALLEFRIDAASLRDARACAAHGYVAVIAYTRGRHVAGARAVPFEFDGEDATTVIDWIAGQRWSDGRVGMYGGGYSGFAAWAATKHRSPALRAIATWSAMAPGIDFPMTDRIPVNAAYRWALAETDIGHAGPRSDRVGSGLDASWYASGRAYQDFPRIGGVLNRYFSRWINHPSYDRYWQKMIPFDGEFASIDIPTLSITGYYDRGEVGALYYWQERARFPGDAAQTFVIGPYGAEDGGGGAAAATAIQQAEARDPVTLVDLRELRLQWFDWVFRSGPKPALLADRVNYEVPGTNTWRHVASLDAMATESLRFYLDGTPTSGGRRLTRKPGSRTGFAAQTVDMADRRDAGRTGIGCPEGRTPERADMLVFSTPPLTQPLEIAGLFSGRLDLRVNKMDFDLGLALYERRPDGTCLPLYEPAYEFRASYARDRRHRHLLRAGVRESLTFTSDRLAGRRLEAGNTLVLVLGIVKRPDREINYGTGNNVSEDAIDEGRVPLRVRWYSSSYLTIPVRR